MTETKRKAKVMKTLKSTKSCAICKRYVKKLNRRFSKQVPPYIPSAKEIEQKYQDCKRFYCNGP